MEDKQVFSVVPSYPLGMRSKSPSGCPKVQIVPNPVYATFFRVYIVPVGLSKEPSLCGLPNEILPVGTWA